MRLHLCSRLTPLRCWLTCLPQSWLVHAVLYSKHQDNGQCRGHVWVSGRMSSAFQTSHFSFINLCGCLYRLLRTLECFTNGILLVDVHQLGWPVQHANKAWAEQTGVPRNPRIQNVAGSDSNF